MNLDHAIKIIFFLASASIGNIFGILRGRIFASKDSSYLHNIFKGFSILLILGSFVVFVIYWEELKNTPEDKYFELSVLVSSIILGVILLLTSKKYLFEQNIYKSSELDPKVNTFTEDADKKEIKLFGGDLNFLGEYPPDLDVNNQYIHLRAMRFQKVLILCEFPKSRTQEMRYGKILSDITGAELRFYNPDSADLRVRGRIIQVNGVDRLLIYKKIKSKVYRAIKTDTADSEGALYNNIWQLVWSLAHQPSNDDIAKYKSLLN